MRLMLDFVGNHVAVDHPWVTQKPHLFVQGTEEELAANPANYFKVGTAIVAHGRDSMFDGWEVGLRFVGCLFLPRGGRCAQTQTSN
jgi:hypothetical protein